MILNQLKNLPLAFIALIGATIFQPAPLASQQQKADFGLGSKCLEVYAEAYGAAIADSCSSIYWKVGGKIVQGNPLNYSFSAPGTYEVCLKIQNTCWKWDTTICKKVTVDTCPTKKCDIKAEINIHKLFGSYYLFQAGGNGTHFEWDWGDGNRSVGKSPWYRLTTRGYHTICLTAYNADKTCSTKVCKTIWIGSPCNIKGDFMMKHNGNGEYHFNVYKSNGYSYSWDFGDGHSGSGADPKHAYSKPGTYNICLTISSKDGQCKKTICKKITIAKGSCDLSKAQWGYSVKCKTLTVEHSNLNANNPDSCWSYKYLIKQNGQVLWDAWSYSSNRFTYTFKNNGSYVVCIQFKNNCTGCDTIICKEVNVKCEETPCDWSRLQIGYQKGSGEACKSYTFELGSYDTCLRYVTYLYPMNGGKLDTLSNSRVFKYTFKDTGSYYLIFSLKNICTGCDTMIYKRIDVTCTGNNTGKKCDWSKLKVGYSNKCKTYTFELGAMDTACLVYMSRLYNPRTQKVDTVAYDRVYSYTFKDTGLFYMVHSIKNICTGCDTTIYQKIHVDCIENNSPCHWTGLTWSMGNNCNKYTFEGPSTIDTCVKYAWKMGSNGAMYTMSQDRVFKYTFNYKGTYTICLTLSNACKNCDTTICKTVEVSCMPCPAEAYFTIDSISASGRVYISNKSSNANTYYWDFGDSSYSYQQSPSKSYGHSGTYTICLKVYNQQANCYNTFCKTISIVIKRSRETQAVDMGIYPNPADEYLHLKGTAEVHSYEITNAAGQRVQGGSLQGNSIDLRALPNGYYMLRLPGHNPQAFIVQHP